MTTGASKCQMERTRLAQIRLWLRQCVEVCADSSEFGFIQVRKHVAAKLIKKHGGHVHGRYCDVFEVLFLEPHPF